MTMATRFALGFCAALLPAALCSSARGSDWEGPLCKPAPREEVFEFARKPTVRKAAGDRYEITFASKGRCDVAVAIEGAGGTVVRLVVAGVLGLVAVILLAIVLPVLAPLLIVIITVAILIKLFFR
jgi:hypothetical protein